jgi:hypothetical protein
MVGSQEVELGAGWNYKYILTPFGEKSFSADEFAAHIVACYQKTYSHITHDYTLSAVDLARLPALADSVNSTSSLLQNCLHNQLDKSVKTVLANCRAKGNCTCFDEPSYVDLGHLYKNILSKVNLFSLSTSTQIIDKLISELQRGNQLL